MGSGLCPIVCSLWPGFWTAPGDTANSRRISDWQLLGQNFQNSTVGHLWVQPQTSSDFLSSLHWLEVGLADPDGLVVLVVFSLSLLVSSRRVWGERCNKWFNHPSLPACRSICVVCWLCTWFVFNLLTSLPYYQDMVQPFHFCSPINYNSLASTLPSLELRDGHVTHAGQSESCLLTGPGPTHQGLPWDFLLCPLAFGVRVQSRLLGSPSLAVWVMPRCSGRNWAHSAERSRDRDEWW